MEHDERADRLERQGDDLEQQSERLREEVAHVRDDWEAKKGDGSLPGAQPGEDEPDEGDAEVEGDATHEAS